MKRKTGWKTVFIILLIPMIGYLTILSLATATLPDIALSFDSSRKLLCAVLGSTAFWMCEGIALHIAWTEMKKEKP